METAKKWLFHLTSVLAAVTLVISVGYFVNRVARSSDKPSFERLAKMTKKLPRGEEVIDAFANHFTVHVVTRSVKENGVYRVTVWELRQSDGEPIEEAILDETP